MMKRILYVSLAVLGLGMAGCSNEELGQVQRGNDEVNASIDTEGTRTAMSGTSVVWSERDEIGVFANNASLGHMNVKYTLTSGEGTTSATFNGTPEGGYVKRVAYYPYSDLATYVGSAILLNLADEFTYAENANNKAPMACLVSETAQSILPFRNAGALMKATLTNIPAGYTWVKLTSKDGLTPGDAPAIAGAAQITFDGDGVPTLAMASGDGKSITINFGTDASTSKTFYFPLPVADYPALELSIGNDTETKVLKTKALPAARNKSFTTEIIFDELTGEIPDEVSSVAEASAALQSSNAVSFTSIASAGTIEIPDRATPNLSISFDQISISDPIVIQSASGATNVADNVMVSIPESETAPQFNIDLPASTVTLAANGGTATYDVVTASTAANTLIIDKGVTVNKVVVNKGNIRVNKGATLGDIENKTSGTVTIYKEADAVIPNGLGSDFMVVDAAVADMKEIFTKGGTYTLQSDMNIIGTNVEVPAGIAATLDLNGHTLTSSNYGVTGARDNILVKGTFTLQDSSNGAGKIVASKDFGTGVSYGLIDINGENAKMTMGSGYIYAVRTTPADKGQYAVVVSKGGDFTMTGGKIEAGWYAVTGNGNDAATNSVIQISGGELISTADYAIYLPQAGTTTISGGKVNGACGGIAINRGALNISGNAQILCQNEGNTGTWSDGTGNMGNAALVVAAKYGNCTVNISGGTFSSLKDAAVLDKPVSTYTNTINVTGGTFSDLGALQYLGTGANVKVAMNGDKSSKGFKTKDGQKVEIDMGTHTLTLSDPTVGSSGTETNSCQLLKGSTVTFKNGTLTSNNDAIVIQNYCILLLENMILNTPNADYSISNNNGSCTLNNVTINAKEGGCAFDVYSFSSYEGVTVTVNSGTINGNIEFDGNNSKKNGRLIINGGTITGNLTVNSSYYDADSPNITISSSASCNGTGWSDYVQ